MDRVMLDTLCSGRCFVESTGNNVSWAGAGRGEERNPGKERLPSLHPRCPLVDCPLGRKHKLSSPKLG